VSVVVDTSVVSYILKKHSLAPSYWEILKGHLLGISFMTVAELYCGLCGTIGVNRESSVSGSTSVVIRFFHTRMR